MQDLGFSIEQIAAIAGHKGGSRNIMMVCDKCANLKKLGFVSSQIVAIVGNTGGCDCSSP